MNTNKSITANAFWRNCEGATAIEYSLIAGLIFLAIVLAVNAYADSTSGMYERLSTTMTNAVN